MKCFKVKGKYSICPYCGYKEDTPPDKPYYLVPGTILAGHFIVGIAIGASEYGIIYKCYDTTLGVIVAVKEYFPEGLVKRMPGNNNTEILSTNKEKKYHSGTKRFLMEAQSIAYYSKTKDIVNVYDYFEENNTAYIIMEYVDDDLLSKRLLEGRMPPDEAFQITESIIEAVKKIHARGIIHEDLSPGNIFISLDNKIKIFDFGAAYLNDTEEGTTGSTVIKPGYSAPEQYHSGVNQGYFTDIYPVGAMYYQMLTGQRPPDAMEREVKDVLKSPLELGVSIDENIDRAIMEALAVQPELRFQGIQQLDDALHGKKIAEYPKDKLKKLKRKRNWIVACISLVLTGTFIGAALFNRLYDRENIMFDTKVDKTTVSIWVDSNDSKEALESVKSGLSEANDSDSEAIIQMKEENKDITFEIRNITAKSSKYKNSYENMDAALKSALDGKEKFPDIFLTDNVSDIDKYDTVSYEDNVYQNINTDEYLYFSSYDEYFPDMKEMPVSFDVLLFYAIDTKDSTEAMKKQFKKKKISSSTLADKGNSDGTIELKDIFKANSAGKEYTYINENNAALVSIFYNDGSFDNYDGTFNKGSKFSNTFSKCMDMKSSAKEKKTWTISSGKDTISMYGNSVLAGSGYRSKWFAAKLGNNSIPYKVFVPVTDGKMLVQYKMKLAISGKSGENKQIAAMRFVYFALGQQQCAVDKDTAYPVSDALLQGTEGENSTFDEFFTINTAQETVKKLVKEKRFPCIVLAKGSGDINRLAKGIKEKKLLYEKDIEKYFNEFNGFTKKKEVAVNETEK